MKTNPLTTEDLCGVFAVSPLARRGNPSRAIDWDQNRAIVDHIQNGGITRLLYGGNAFLYHVTLNEYEELICWLEGLPDDLLVIPSVGPSFGRSMDQADLLRGYSFPCVMVLPCGDPRDAAGLERGYRELADAAGAALVVYLKDETNFGQDREAGLDAIARLVEDNICVAIKYAVVRSDPSRDPYLEALLRRVDRRIVISGIGERPAVIHMRDWKLPGFTTGSGCVAPRLCQSLFEACARGDFDTAESLRREFIALEDLRDRWGPSTVLHSALRLAGVADTGPVVPFVSSLSAEQEDELSPVSRTLAAKNAAQK